MKALARLSYPIVFALTVGFFNGDCCIPDRTYLGGGSFARSCSGIFSGEDYFAPEETAAEHNGWAIFRGHGRQEKRPAVESRTETPLMPARAHEVIQ
jgi:hypothetical protein